MGGKNANRIQSRSCRAPRACKQNTFAFAARRMLNVKAAVVVFKRINDATYGYTFCIGAKCRLFQALSTSMETRFMIPPGFPFPLM